MMIAVIVLCTQFISLSSFCLGEYTRCPLLPHYTRYFPHLTSPPAEQSARSWSARSSSTSHRTPSEQSARSWLLRSTSSSPAPPSSPEQSTRSWSPLRSLLAPPRSSGLPSGSGSPARPGACPVSLLAPPLGCTLLREWLPSPPGGLPSNACLGVHGVQRRRRCLSGGARGERAVVLILGLWRELGFEKFHLPLRPSSAYLGSVMLSVPQLHVFMRLGESQECQVA